MPDFESLGQGVFHIDAHYIKPDIASLYCVLEKNEIAIIETGTAHSLPYVKRFLDAMSLSNEQVRYVIPTHVHLDHAGGAGVMMREFPNAELVIHPRGARHMIDPGKLLAATKALYGESHFNTVYGEFPPIDEDRIIIADHETTIEFNGREFLIVDTPGHAFHHFCVVDLISRGIFSGDTFGIAYPNLVYKGKRIVLPSTTPIHFNPEKLQKSVDMLMSLQPEQIYLTHFNVLPNPAEVVDQYKSWIDKYVTLTERIKPVDDPSLESLITAMGNMISDEFELNLDQVKDQLAMDIRLNCQGLAVWYQRSLDE